MPASDRRWAVSAAAAVLALGACAQTPESVAPVAVDEARYDGMFCADMAVELAHANRLVALFSTEQSAKRANDAVAWTRVLHPADSARRRDIRSHLALAKGEGEALNRAMARRCPGLRP